MPEPEFYLPLQYLGTVKTLNRLRFFWRVFLTPK
jgi:hypothetical protein